MAGNSFNELTVDAGARRTTMRIRRYVRRLGRAIEMEICGDQYEVPEVIKWADEVMDKMAAELEKLSEVEGIGVRLVD